MAKSKIRARDGRPKRAAKRPIWLFMTLGVVAFVGGVIAFSVLQGSGPGQEEVSANPAPVVTVDTFDGPYRIGGPSEKTLLVYFSFPG